MGKLSSVIEKILKTAATLDSNGYFDQADKLEKVANRIAQISTVPFFYGHNTLTNPVNEMSQAMSPNAPGVPFTDESGRYSDRPVEIPTMGNDIAENTRNLQRYYAQIYPTLMADSQRNMKLVYNQYLRTATDLNERYRRGQMDQMAYMQALQNAQSQYNAYVSTLQNANLQTANMPGENAPR